MKSYISKKAAALEPYTAGEQPRKQMIKLNTNENPYPPSPSVAEAIIASDFARLRLYPDPSATDLKAAIAKKEGVKSENIFVGNGSDEVLGFAFLALFDSFSKPVAFPDVTYSFYPVYCRLFDIAYKTVPLRADLTLDFDGYYGEEYAGAIIANPNAPTSLSHSRKELLSFVKRFDRPVIVDEAYTDFANEKSLAVETLDCKNLLVVKTFSKSYSLAGMRCGYAVGDKQLIFALDCVKDSFNSYPLDMICQRAATAAMLDEDYHKAHVEMVKKTRERAKKQMQILGGSVLNSETNFLFVRFKGITGGDLCFKLREKGILARHFSAPRTDDYLRITIGTEVETDVLIDALKDILSRVE